MKNFLHKYKNSMQKHNKMEFSSINNSKLQTNRLEIHQMKISLILNPRLFGWDRNKYLVKKNINFLMVLNLAMFSKEN